MCRNCFQDYIYSFDSHTAFDAFEKELQAKCTSNQLAIVNRHETEYISAFSSYLYYQCNNCKELWVKSIPDNAWRGFFLPEQEAFTYTKKLRRFDKARAAGCLVLMAIIFILIIWVWVS